MELENRGLEDDWLVSKGGPFSTSMVMGGRVLGLRFGGLRDWEYDGSGAPARSGPKMWVPKI